MTSEHLKQFDEQGYFILEEAMSDEQLEGLGSECQRFINLMNAEMDAKGVDTIDITHRNRRYFIGNRYKESEIVTHYVFSDLMAEITQKALGDDVFLFAEQYVVKSAEVGMKFGWHQDGGYIGHPHRPYLTCWSALDDMSEENGTVYILPFDRAGTRDCVPHYREEGSNDLIGYTGDDPGIPVIVPAGSIAVLSSTTFHRSGANATDRMRRSYLAQYSAEPIMNKEGTELWNMAKPFLKDGKRVVRS
ncbi:MAG: phytanoyl-CoA dioxygenase family protein [Candidatus Geothermarchaeales archaeon]